MAEDFRTSDTSRDLNEFRSALVKECAEQSRNALYTSTSFYVWLRTIKLVRGLIWVLAVASSAAAASAAISKTPGLELLVAGLALLGVILPGVAKALKLDDTIASYEKAAAAFIASYEKAAAAFKVVEGKLRRVARVWSNKPMIELESEAKKAIAELETAQKFSLTPPEWCFRVAQKKVQKGDYEPDPIS